jgi:hypothetical protein
VSCVLRAGGETFNVDSFLADSLLEVCAVFRRGEPRLASRPNGPKSEQSGINIPIGESEMDDLSGQIQDAVSFLEQQEAELRRLVGFPDVESVGLDFGIAWRDVVRSY